ncbi:MAG: hypothetical protein KBT46_06055, partial [Ruminococcus sp.]|nr:hypothetical protein [Candidatus Copronaster equi]
TWTYERTNAKVQSIKGYDKDGNEVETDSRRLAYGVWEVNASLKLGSYKAVGKFESGWNNNPDSVATFEVIAKSFS